MNTPRRYNRMTSEKPASNHPTESIAEAKSVIETLQFARRILSLYSEEHTKFQSAVMRLKNSFDTYFGKHNELCIRVREKRLIVDDEVVYEGTAKDGDIAFALFRDGMLKLTFQAGIDLHETKIFVKILHKYKVIPAEAEGDIVTALWEAQLPHIDYEAADSMIETDSESAGSLEKGEKHAPGGATQQNSASLFKSLETLKSGDASRELVDRAKQSRLVDMDLLELKPTEIKVLKEMVQKGELRDASGEILNMMADILKEQEGQEFFDVVLTYLKEGLQKALANKDFTSGYQILKRLHQVRILSKESSPSIHPGIKEFFVNVSGEDFLAVLKDPWPKLNESELERAKRTLTLLPPKATVALGPLLTEKQSPAVGKLIADVIVALAARDVRPLEQLLNNAGEDLVYRLVPLLGRTKGKESIRILIKLLDHPAERVRMEVIKVLARRNLWIPEKLIALLDDESGDIRQTCLDYLGSRRCEKTEMLLLNYLKKRKFRSKERDHQSACYRALGKCGKADLIPFLRDALLKGGLFSKFLVSAHRKGAAIALMELKTDKAKQVLVMASRSGFPGIRKVALKVL